MNQGDEWQTISGDLTQGGKKGDVAYGTLTTIDESPLRFGLLYAGSDDGLVHVSKDGGTSWEPAFDGLPADLWVGQIVASEHSESRVYLVVNGYRNDNFEPYLFRSEDYGHTWSPLGDDLPLEPLNTVCEDPVNPNLLYVGSDHGVYASLDGGASFHTFDNSLPKVAVHDLLVHPESNELIVGTHGRSIYLADVAPLQEMDNDLIASDLHLFPV